MPWVGKCPECGAEMTKENPEDEWKCGNCGWERKDKRVMSGVEPQTAFEGYIKGNVEELRREMGDVKTALISLEEQITKMANQASFSRGKMIGWGSAFGVMGGVGAAIIKALWR